MPRLSELSLANIDRIVRPQSVFIGLAMPTRTLPLASARPLATLPVFVALANK